MSRKKFNEEVAERINELATALLNEVPELEGIAVALTYDPTVGEPKPNCMVFGDVKDPLLLNQMGTTALQLVGAHVEGLMAHFRAGGAAIKRLTDEIDAKQKQCDQTSQESADEVDGDQGDPATGGSPNTSQSN